MQRIKEYAAAFILSTLTLYPLSASAVLVNEESGLQATGRVATGGPPLSNKTETEITLPFTRSIVSVSDSQASFSYLSSADIGALALKVSGTLTNTGATELINPNFLPLLQVTAQARDVITLTSSLPGSFDVTLELLVNGSIDAANGNASANSSLSFGPNPGLNQTIAKRYLNGPIQDTLSITQTVSGPVVNMDFDAFLSFNSVSVAPGGTVSGELSNTALLNLILPVGVSVTDSGSGTFGVSIPPVPEPQTYALMLAGIGVVGCAALRRRAKATFQ